MKKMFLAVALMLPFVASAEFIHHPIAPVGPVTLAGQLSSGLQAVSNQAQFEANQTFDFQRARTLNDVAYLTRELAQGVSSDVYYPLVNGQPYYVAAQGLERLQYRFNQATQLMLQLGFLSPQLNNLSTQVRNSHVQLKGLLGVGPGPGPFPTPVSAACQVEVGPLGRSNVRCTVYGLGVTGYQVYVNGAPVWAGALFPQMQTQTFVTDRRAVGGVFANYQVFLMTNGGGRVMAFSK